MSATMAYINGNEFRALHDESCWEDIELMNPEVFEESRRMTRKLHRPHWYLVTTYYCVLCGKTEVFKERRYTPKPKRYEDRHNFHEHGCYSCQYGMFIG